MHHTAGRSLTRQHFNGRHQPARRTTPLETPPLRTVFNGRWAVFYNRLKGRGNVVLRKEEKEGGGGGEKKDKKQKTTMKTGVKKKEISRKIQEREEEQRD